ncbi:hypothetical protein Ancab_004533 [Ancistrocladus abbreviatus]
MEASGCFKPMLRFEGEQAEFGAPALELSISMVPSTPDELIGVPPIGNDNLVGVAENSTHAQLAFCNVEERELSCQREHVGGQSETRSKKLIAKPPSRKRSECPQFQEAICPTTLMALQKGWSEGEIKSWNFRLIETVDDVEKSEKCKEAIKESKGKVVMVHVVEKQPSNSLVGPGAAIREHVGPAHTQMVPNSPSTGGDTNRGRIKKALYPGTLRLGWLGLAEGLLEAQPSQRNLLTRDGKEKIGKQLRLIKSKTKRKGKTGRRSDTKHPLK